MSPRPGARNAPPPKSIIPVTHDNRPQFLPRLAQFVSQKLDNVVVLIDGAVVVFSAPAAASRRVCGQADGSWY